MKTLLRRLERHANSPQTQYQCRPLTVDLSRHELRLARKVAPSTGERVRLVGASVAECGTGIDPRAAQRRLGYDYYGTARTVDVHVRRLKQKLPILDDAIVSIKSLTP